MQPDNRPLGQNDMLPKRQTAKQQKRERGEQAWENELRWTWRKRNI